MEKKGKIAFIKTGSFSNINRQLSDALKRAFAEYRVDIVDTNRDLADCRHPGNLAACIRAYGWDVLRGTKELRAALMRTPYLFSKVRRAVARLKNENYAFTLQTQSLLDASIPGVPHFVYTDHTHLANLSYPAFDKKQLYPDSWIALESEIYHRAALVFTMSSHISKSLTAQYRLDPAKVRTVYCGGNVNVDRRTERDENRYAAKNILFVGVDWERKGGPQLVAAFRRVLKRHPDARLTIVGCSPRITLRNCRVVGKIPLSEMGRYYDDASVFCLPTRLEPFGIVFIEAFAYGLPIVATPIGALPDIVSSGESGYLVDGDDIGQLADRLIALLGDAKQCREFGRRGAASIGEKYSWEKTAQRIRRHIDGFLSKQHFHRQLSTSVRLTGKQLEAEGR